MKKALLVGLAVLSLWGNGQILSAQQPLSKWFEVEGAVNTQSAFLLGVNVDRPDRIYTVGQTMTVTVKPEKDCYLYLLYYGAGGQVACLFPNKYQQDNFVHVNAPVTVPASGADFQFVCRPPCGKEMLQAIGTLKPVESLGKKQLTTKALTMLDTPTLKEMVVELKKGAPRDWAEARIDIVTQESGDRPAAKRYAVCVGISQYKSDRVPPLQVSHKDAERMAAALKEHGHCDEVTLLTNSQATLAAIENAIFKELPRKTKPGDSILLFFSCHGGRCADTSGEKPDGLAKYLVPYDGEIGNPESMLLDRTFARWIRELDGREIGIILDNCYSAGMAKGARAKGVATPLAKGLESDVFLISELRRSKALTQAGVMVLAACEGNQLAWEMSEEGQGSALTCYVLKAIGDTKADVNSDGHLSVGEAYRYVKPLVEDYVRKTFSAEQNPVLLDLDNDRFVLKP